MSFSTPHTGRGNQQTRTSSQQSPSQVGDFGPARVTTSLRPPCTFTARQTRRQPRGNRAPPNAAVSAAAPLTPRLLRRPSTAPPRTQPAPGTCQLSPERNGSTPQRLRRNQSRTRRARSTAHSRAAASITCAQPRVPNCRAPRAGQAQPKREGVTAELPSACLSAHAPGHPGLRAPAQHPPQALTALATQPRQFARMHAACQPTSR